jgi:hypothetical protein
MLISALYLVLKDARLSQIRCTHAVVRRVHFEILLRSIGKVPKEDRVC